MTKWGPTVYDKGLLKKGLGALLCRRVPFNGVLSCIYVGVLYSGSITCDRAGLTGPWYVQQRGFVLSRDQWEGMRDIFLFQHGVLRQFRVVMENEWRVEGE